jgi:hypothetical protein
MAEDALKIYQAWLDETSGHFVANDLEPLRRHYALPFLYHSQTNRIILETWPDLGSDHAAFAGSLRRHGVDQLIRLASSAEFLSERYIEGSHVAHAMRRGRQVVPSSVTRFVLRRDFDGWKAIEQDTTLNDEVWPVDNLSFGDEPRRKVRRPKFDIRRESDEPLALYQRFLNRMTQANVAGDFDGFRKLFGFPHWVHTGNANRLVNSVAQTRSFFDMVTRMLKENEIEEFVRIGDRAEFISATEICGYHTSRFLAGGRDALPAIKSRMILRRSGTRWLLHSVTNAVRGGDYPYTEPFQVVGDLVTDREIQERTKTWPNSH